MFFLLNLFSSVALLAWGVYITKNAVLKAYGANLNQSIAKTLSTKLWPFRAMLSGLLTTMLIQSSNATAMLISSFLGKGIIALTPALIIMLGADLGTALMARILTFDLSWLCPLLILVGTFLHLKLKKRRAGKIGRIILGLGIILLALSSIVKATSPVVSSSIVLTILESLNGQVTFGIIFGALLAIICYSSLAAVLLSALIAGSGHLSVETGIALVIGANLGSCCLEIMGATGQGNSAKKVMFGNTFFKLTITILVLPFIDKLKPEFFNLTTREFIIWFHVFFNLAVCVVILPLIKVYANLLDNIFPEDPKQNNEDTPMYLDHNAIDNPALALSNATRETLRIGGFLHEILGLFTRTVTGQTGLSEKINLKIASIEALSREIINYLDEIEIENTTKKRWNQITAALMACLHSADIIKKMQQEVSSLNKNPVINFSAHNRQDVVKLIKTVNENLSFALNAFMTDNESEIAYAFKKKAAFKLMTDKNSIRQIYQINEHSTANPVVTALMLTIISDLRQLNGVFCSIASSKFADIDVNETSNLDENTSLIAQQEEHN